MLRKVLFGTPFARRNPELTPFRYMREGRGGTLNFRGEGPSRDKLTTADMTDRELMHHVGTYGLKTCVGIYFAIDDERCFLPHINALRWHSVCRSDLTGSTSHVGPDRAVRDDAEAEWFREKARKKLESHACAHGWNSKMARSRILQSLIIACPQPEQNTGQPVIDGVKDFLGAPPDTPVHKSEGFVVRHPGGLPEMLVSDESRRRLGDQGRNAPGLEKYEPLLETGDEVWAFEKEY